MLIGISVGVVLATLLVIFWQPLKSLAPAFLSDQESEIKVSEEGNREEIAEEDKIKILLVPGHDLDSAGTVFKDLKEEELNRELTEDIYEILAGDQRFKTYTTRDFETGEYTEEFVKYFTSSEAQIMKFRNKAKDSFNNLLNTGLIIKYNPDIKHNEATTDVAFKLYGINKWANDHDVDLALHIHFNDVPRKDKFLLGPYRGFAIYVPESQLSNASSSREVAEVLYEKIDRVSAQSNFPLEADGIIESQELIATGSYNSQEHPAVLVEYGYIYEPKYSIANRRYKSFPILAEATYDGLVKYFFK